MDFYALLTRILYHLFIEKSRRFKAFGQQKRLHKVRRLMQPDLLVTVVKSPNYVNERIKPECKVNHISA